MSGFLSLREKHDVFNQWVGVIPSLNASELKVLFRLLKHQNPRTGRCDPSIAGLSENTGTSTRMVRKAIKGLEERGAIKVLSRVRGRRNTYRIDNMTRQASLKVGKPGSQREEREGHKVRNCRSSEKGRKKERKRACWNSFGMDSETTSQQAIAQGNRHQRRLREKMLENKAREAFEAIGMSYEDLVGISTEKWLQVFEAFDAGEMLIDAAVETLFNAARDPDD